MHLADSGILSDLQLPTISQLTQGLTATPVTPTPQSSSGGSDWWNTALKTIGNLGTAGLQVFGAIKQAQYLQNAGIQPIGYSNGLPVYGSTPAGVTPSNPYSLPSGMALPVGVTPNYAITPGATTVSTSLVNPLANLLTGTTGTYLMLGSLGIFAILMLQKNRRK